MEDARKLEDSIKAACARPNHYQLWPIEGVSDSPYYSPSEGVYYDTLLTKKSSLSKVISYTRSPRKKKSQCRQFKSLHRKLTSNHFVCMRIENTTKLAQTIQSSRRILELKDDWDEEGSPGYSEETWRRAVEFLIVSRRRYWKETKKSILVPKISPGPYGSIDLHWKTPDRELLINIPKSLEEPASYYGDDREDGTENAIRGKSLDTSQYERWIFDWLMQ